MVILHEHTSQTLKKVREIQWRKTECFTLLAFLVGVFAKEKCNFWWMISALLP